MKLMYNERIGTPVGWCSVQHVVLCIVRVDNKLEAWPINDVTCEVEDESREPNGAMGSSRGSANDARRDGPAATPTKRKA